MANEISAGYEIDGTTLTLGRNNTIQLNPANTNTWTVAQTFNASINPNISQTTLTGATAGSIAYSMPFQGTSYKKFVAYVNGYENDTTTAQNITFPVAFSITPNISTAPSGLISSISTTSITLASGSTTTYNGVIIIEGW